ncbi:hypothetical protein DIPPA_34486 [Diplonema papillatum]|nr:hypothetical protein DIPPA_34486 [Diplonema papillatum]
MRTTYPPPPAGNPALAPLRRPELRWAVVAAALLLLWAARPYAEQALDGLYWLAGYEPEPEAGYLELAYEYLASYGSAFLCAALGMLFGVLGYRRWNSRLGSSEPFMTSPSVLSGDYSLLSGISQNGRRSTQNVGVMLPDLANPPLPQSWWMAEQPAALKTVSQTVPSSSVRMSDTLLVSKPDLSTPAYHGNIDFASTPQLSTPSKPATPHKPRRRTEERRPKPPSRSPSRSERRVAEALREKESHRGGRRRGYEGTAAGERRYSPGTARRAPDPDRGGAAAAADIGGILQHLAESSLHNERLLQEVVALVASKDRDPPPPPPAQRADVAVRSQASHVTLHAYRVTIPSRLHKARQVWVGRVLTPLVKTGGRFLRAREVPLCLSSPPPPSSKTDPGSCPSPNHSESQSQSGRVP